MEMAESRVMGFVYRNSFWAGEAAGSPNGLIWEKQQHEARQQKENCIILLIIFIFLL
ncbi:MAG TPA: hypothetical protein VLC98_05015 [Phnomibacter sp.]|nr:hypothetical protein [Phnomibacter sp.]